MIRIISRFRVPILINLLSFFLGVLIALEFINFKIGYMKPSDQLYLNIFLNNFRLGIFILIAGLFTFGVLGTFILFYNGCLIGLDIKYIYSNYGIDPIITGLLPHFFLELFSLVCFSALGSISGMYFLAKLQNKSFYINSYFKDAFYLLSVSVFVMFIASLIEDYISHVTI